jgi:hypothetical protein
MDDEQLIAADEDLGDLHAAIPGEAFGEDVDEQVLVVLVEHVGQAIGGQLDQARQDAILAVGHELEVAGRPAPGRRVRHGRLGGGGPAEHDAEAVSDALDHGQMVSVTGQDEHPPGSTARGIALTVDTVGRREVPGVP